MRDFLYIYALTLLYFCGTVRSFINELAHHHTNGYNVFRSLSTSDNHFVSLAQISTNMNQAMVYCSFYNDVTDNWDEAMYVIEHSPYNTQIRTGSFNQNINNAIFLLFNTTTVFFSSVAQPESTPIFSISTYNVTQILDVTFGNNLNKIFVLSSSPDIPTGGTSYNIHYMGTTKMIHYSSTPIINYQIMYVNGYVFVQLSSTLFKMNVN